MSVSLREFVEYLDSFEVRAPKDRDGLPPFYIFDGGVLRASEGDGDSALSGDVAVPLGFESLARFPVYPQFAFGPAGSGAPFHRHCDAVNGLVFGLKRWWLLPPEDAFYTREHPSTLVDSSGRAAGEHARALQCTQHGGDLLFVPQSWGHAVLNEAESVAAAFEFDRGDC